MMMACGISVLPSLFLKCPAVIDVRATCIVVCAFAPMFDNVVPAPPTADPAWPDHL
jgi:hypothetical protein